MGLLGLTQFLKRISVVILSLMAHGDLSLKLLERVLLAHRHIDSPVPTFVGSGEPYDQGVFQPHR
jgi:hypothetical protein